MEELNRCPFCGGEATVMEAVGEVWVKCSECHSSNGVSTGERAKAIKAWNTRKEGERFFPFEFEVWCGDEMAASASGPRDTALREAMHYVIQYEQDGPARVFEVTRTLVWPNAESTGTEAGGQKAETECLVGVAVPPAPTFGETT